MAPCGQSCSALRSSTSPGAEQHSSTSSGVRIGDRAPILLESLAQEHVSHRCFLRYPPQRSSALLPGALQIRLPEDSVPFAESASNLILFASSVGSTRCCMTCGKPHMCQAQPLPVQIRNEPSAFPRESVHTQRVSDERQCTNSVGTEFRFACT